MSGHIGIIANDAGRYTLFTVALSQMQQPTNTGIIWRLTTDLANGRNYIIEKALEAGSEWVLFLDDDHSFPPNLLPQLLSHDVPVVGALYLQRSRPFAPIAYVSKDDRTGVYTYARLVDLPPTGLVPVRAIGTGGLLIRSEVFRAIDWPWFEHVRASEDLTFCDKVHDAGIPIYVDCAARLAHLGTAAMWPTYDKDTDEWAVGFSLADGFSLIAALDDAEEPAVVG